MRSGGTLVALPGAATADEANEPSTVLDDVLSVAGRAAWEPLRDAAHLATTFGLSHRLTVSDEAWQSAIGASGPLLLRDMVAGLTARLVDFPTLQPAGAQAVATLAPAADPNDARPAITRQASVGRVPAPFIGGMIPSCLITVAPMCRVAPISSPSTPIRRQIFLTDADVRSALREAVGTLRLTHPFVIEAWVLLPDHMHAVWTSPPGDPTVGVGGCQQFGKEHRINQQH